MDERSDQITRDIEQTRGELGANIQELETKIKDATDWRHQFQKRPLTMIGLAFGGGVLLSRSMGGTSVRRYRAGARGNSHEREEGLSYKASEGTRFEMKKVADTWDSIKGALIGVAANKVNEFLRSAVPGFHEEFTKVENHKRPQRLGETPPQTPKSSVL